MLSAASRPSNFAIAAQPRAAARALSCLLLCGAMTSSLWAQPALAQGSPGGGLFQSMEHGDTKLDDPRPEKGWQGLANLLEKIKPSTDTRLDPSATQFTDRIQTLIANNRLDDANALIEKRRAQLAVRGPRGGGDDVQLAFQQARLLARMGRTDEAIARYSEMTVSYPELPEPWNNLAGIYAAQGQLGPAANALTQSLRANPTDKAVQANLADVNRAIARQGPLPSATPKISTFPSNPDAPVSAEQ